MKIVHAALALLLFASPAAAGEGLRFQRIADGRTVELAAVSERAAASRVVFIGEAHDSAEQHRQQLEIIRYLHARKVPLAVGIEMFASDAQKQLDDWVQGKLEEEAFRRVYASQWSFDWKLYRDIFLFARDNRIPLVALNVPKPVMSKVVRGGSASLGEADRRELPPGGPWAPNATQAEYLRRIRAQLGNRPSPFPLSNFMEAQALRNAAFAWNIARFREKSPKSLMVAIVGTWHAIRSGAPQDLRKHGNPPSMVILPQLPELEAFPPGPEEADYLMLNAVPPATARPAGEQTSTPSPREGNPAKGDEHGKLPLR
ncbi:MAG TPA: ChaN family lipoprotein [Verrucomicrobiae bacterium]|nr:ChaN family lipoprotein [Verrucomicrobiae bacterium]